MPNSTAVSQFQASVLAAFDALRRENELRDARLREAELALAREAGAAGVAIDPSRIVKLEIAAIAPERMRELEQKVTRLDVRSATIGAAGGALASAIVNAALHLFFARLAG